MKQEWVGLREFARRCGRTHGAAQKAIRDGRIPAVAVRRDPKGRIVMVEHISAALAWGDGTDPRQALRSSGPLRTAESADVCTGPDGRGLAQAIALARVDFLNNAEGAGWETPPRELADIVWSYTLELCIQLRCMGFSLPYQLLDAVEHDDTPMPESLDEIRARARAEVPQ